MADNYAMLRVAKIKSLASLKGAATHNDRSAKRGTEHADNSASRMGGGVQLLAGSEDAAEAWHDRMKAANLDPSKQRKDGVKAVEMCLFASPGWFDSATPDERQEWARRSVAFAAEKLGENNLLSVHLHDDESTPHIHAVAIPLIQKERAATGRRRKDRPAPKTKTRDWGLSARDYIGGSKATLQQFQTDYARAVADLGLRRGQPGRVTQAEHKSPTAYRAEQAAATEAAKASKEKADGRLKSIEEGVQAFATGFDAADVGDLLVGDDNRIKAKNENRKVLSNDESALKRWREKVQPVWKPIAAYTRRIASLKRREEAVSKREAEADRDEAALRAARERFSLDRDEALARQKRDRDNQKRGDHR